MVSWTCDRVVIVAVRFLQCLYRGREGGGEKREGGKLKEGGREGREREGGRKGGREGRGREGGKEGGRERGKEG